MLRSQAPPSAAAATARMALFAQFIMVGDTNKHGPMRGVRLFDLIWYLVSFATWHAWVVEKRIFRLVHH